MIFSFLALAVALIWTGLLLGRDFFWLARVADHAPCPTPAHWPSVIAIVPARNEAEVIGSTVSSLLAQDYPGDFSVILVDDGSADATADIARAVAGSLDRLEVTAAPPLPNGWTGKLWAVSHGIASASTRGTADTRCPDYLWLTDADITHTPDALRNLVLRAEAGDYVLVSRMALLRCQSFAERALIPAFVFFFQLLYPFRAVNNRRRTIAAAAGGCMLVSRPALEAAGGIAAIRTALIDDCALGAALKRQGNIWLGLSRDTVSIRPYPNFIDVGAMISRSAYAQLGYNPLLLLGTLLGLALTYLAPPLLAIFGQGPTRWLGLLAWLIMAALFQPMLRLYKRSPFWGVVLPLIASYYGAATFWSAWQHQRGRGGQWKGRVQAALR